MFERLNSGVLIRSDDPVAAALELHEDGFCLQGPDPFIALSFWAGPAGPEPDANAGDNVVTFIFERHAEQVRALFLKSQAAKRALIVR